VRDAPTLWTQPVGGYSPPSAAAPSTLQLVLEDLKVVYDPVNNPLTITDARTEAEWPSGARPISRSMTYDDLYRLTEIDYQSGNDVQVSPFQAELARGDVSPVPLEQITNRVARQTFNYDFLGNLTGSDDDVHAFYDRSLATVQNGSPQQYPNRFHSASSSVGETAQAAYDASGNLEELDLIRKGTCAAPPPITCSQRFNYEWDEIGRLTHASRWDYKTSTGPQPVLDSDLRYAYDATGVRVVTSKTDATGNQSHTATVFDSLRLNHTTWNSLTGDYERSPGTEEAYLPGIARVVYLQPGLPSVNGARQHVFLTMGDNLGSLSVVVDRATGELVEAATYMAFGAAETDYRPPRWNSYREEFRYTGKEDDIEVGLSYFGARYYHSLLGKWISPDPLSVHGLGSDQNPYAFAHNSPFSFVDSTGLDGGCLGKEQGCVPTPFCFIFCFDSGGGGGGGGSSGGSKPGSSGAGSSGPPPPPPPMARASTGIVGASGTGFSIANPWYYDDRWLADAQEKIIQETIAMEITIAGFGLGTGIASIIEESGILGATSWQAAKAAAIPIGQYVLQAAAAVNGNYIGGAIQPSEVAEGNDLLAPGLKFTGNTQNQIKGIVGNEASAYFVQEADPGAVRIGQEVTIRVNGERMDLDSLFVNSNGNLIAPEAKFGLWARFTANQHNIFSTISPGGGWVIGVPEGNAAAESGLVEGEPVMIYLFRMRFNWPLNGN
jgi:RHS repeat-associated protein